MTATAALRKLETLIRTSDVSGHPEAAVEAEDCLSALWAYVLKGSTDGDGTDGDGRVH